MPRTIPSTKLALVRALSAKADVSQTRIEIVLDALAEFAYAGAAASPRGFSIPGIGRLSVIRRKARRAFNPSTGRAMKVPARDALSFRFSEKAKSAILGNLEKTAPAPPRPAKAAKTPSDALAKQKQNRKKR